MSRLPNEQAAEGVSQVMETDLAQSGSLQCRQKSVVNQVIARRSRCDTASAGVLMVGGAARKGECTAVHKHWIGYGLNCGRE